MKIKLAAGLIGYFLLILLINGCKSKEEDNLSILAMMALLNGPGINFRYMTSNASGSASALSTMDSNLAGDSISDYGDGDADGYNDKFLTPPQISLNVIAIVAWKSESHGGPAPGEERYSNANYILFDCARDISPTGSFCTMLVNVGEKNTVHYLSRWGGLPDDTYDRIGIGFMSLQYEFDDKVAQPNLRWINLSLRYYSMLDDYVTVMLRSPGCPDYTVNLTQPCSVRGVDLDENGALPEYFDGKYPGFIPQYPVAEHPISDKPLKFNPPVDRVNEDGEMYYKIIAVTPEIRDSMELNIDLYPENIMFWDSSGTDNVFDADDPDDTPNGTDRNLKYHLPEMKIASE